MIPAQKGCPVQTGANPDTEMLMYIKYKFSYTAPHGIMINPPCVKQWNQICMFLGHPSLEEREMDFLYGGSSNMLKKMKKKVKNYFENLKEQGIIESYMYDIEEGSLVGSKEE